MSEKSSVEIGGFEFESDDLEYLMKRKAEKNIIEKEDDDVLPLMKRKANKNIIEEEDDGVLPEIMYEILVKLPADYLYQELKLVCKAWKSIISSKDFIVENFAASQPVFLVQCTAIHRRSYQMEIDEKQLSYKIHEFEFNCLAEFKSSCYGMLLIQVEESCNVLKVLNLVTKCCLTLPKCPSHCPHVRCASALGFDPFTNHFKVVHMYSDNFGFEIFTIGDSSNAWKRIPGPWKDSSDNRPPYLLDSGWSDPISISGRFLHWDVGSSNYIISMDVSDEKCIKLKLPCTLTTELYHLVELGGHLSLVYTAANTHMDIWILEDFHSMLWFKKHSVLAKMIESSTYPLPGFTHIYPVGGTSNGVLVFAHTKKRMYFYDMEKKTMKKYTTAIEIERLIVHRSSLFKLQH